MNNNRDQENEREADHNACMNEKIMTFTNYLHIVCYHFVYLFPLPSEYILLHIFRCSFFIWFEFFFVSFSTFKMNLLIDFRMFQLRFHLFQYFRVCACMRPSIRGSLCVMLDNFIISSVCFVLFQLFWILAIYIFLVSLPPFLFLSYNLSISLFIFLRRDALLMNRAIYHVYITVVTHTKRADERDSPFGYFIEPSYRRRRWCAQVKLLRNFDWFVRNCRKWIWNMCLYPSVCVYLTIILL